MRKYSISIMLINNSTIDAIAECSMSIFAQMMALGLLNNIENAAWVRVNDDNGKTLVIYYKRSLYHGNSR